MFDVELFLNAAILVIIKVKILGDHSPLTEISMAAEMGTLVLRLDDRLMNPLVSFNRIKSALLPDTTR